MSTSLHIFIYGMIFGHVAFILCAIAVIILGDRTRRDLLP